MIVPKTVFNWGTVFQYFSQHLRFGLCLKCRCIAGEWPGSSNQILLGFTCNLFEDIRWEHKCGGWFFVMPPHFAFAGCKHGGGWNSLSHQTVKTLPRMKIWYLKVQDVVWLGIEVLSVISVDAAYYTALSEVHGKNPATWIRSRIASQPSSRHYLDKTSSVILLSKGRH